MNYLKYIEHDAENLQFFLWYRDYCQRFDQLPATDKDLSPEWTMAQAEADTMVSQPNLRKKITPAITSILQGTDFAQGVARTVDFEKRDPFHDPFRTPSSEERRDFITVPDYSSSFGDEKSLGSSTVIHRKAEEAFEEAGLKWKPCEYSEFFDIYTLSDHDQLLHNPFVRRWLASSQFILLLMDLAN